MSERDMVMRKVIGSALLVVCCTLFDAVGSTNQHAQVLGPQPQSDPLPTATAKYEHRTDQSAKQSTKFTNQENATAQECAKKLMMEITTLNHNILMSSKYWYSTSKDLIAKRLSVLKSLIPYLSGDFLKDVMEFLSTQLEAQSAGLQEDQNEENPILRAKKLMMDITHWSESLMAFLVVDGAIYDLTDLIAKRLSVLESLLPELSGDFLMWVKKFLSMHIEAHNAWLSENQKKAMMQERAQECAKALMIKITILNYDISKSSLMRWIYTSDCKELRDKKVGCLNNLRYYLSGDFLRKVNEFLSTHSAELSEDQKEAMAQECAKELMSSIMTLNHDISKFSLMQENLTSTWKEFRDKKVGYLEKLLPYLKGCFLIEVNKFLSTISAELSENQKKAMAQECAKELMIRITILNCDISKSSLMRWIYTSDWKELRDKSVGYLEKLLPYLSCDLSKEVNEFLSTLSAELSEDQKEAMAQKCAKDLVSKITRLNHDISKSLKHGKSTLKFENLRKINLSVLESLLPQLSGDFLIAVREFWCEQ
jgi:hypothetical protein